ncbi:MAG: Ig domain-containing protein [Nitrospiraceae bacterium]
MHRLLSITISPVPQPLTITTNSLPVGRRNRRYAKTLVASGGTTPYTWSVTPAVPPGLSLASATGVISGTPTSTSNIDHDFTVRDSTNQTTTKELNLRIRN